VTFSPHGFDRVTGGRALTVSWTRGWASSRSGPSASTTPRPSCASPLPGWPSVPGLSPGPQGAPGRFDFVTTGENVIFQSGHPGLPRRAPGAVRHRVGTGRPAPLPTTTADSKTNRVDWSATRSWSSTRSATSPSNPRRRTCSSSRSPPATTRQPDRHQPSKGDSYRLKDRNVGRVPAATTEENEACKGSKFSRRHGVGFRPSLTIDWPHDEHLRLHARPAP
jgi:hypothetical protein